tara:strand:- start:123642 stop:124391 length:750 start_codon:yes stop_codon:yes gene_type:complete
MIAGQLSEFFDLLNSAKSADARWHALIRFMGEHGADTINYAVLNTLEFEREIAPVIQFSNMSASWIDYYLDQRMDLADPHVRHVREGHLNAYRWDEARTGRLQSEQGRNVLAMAAEEGLRSQISVVAPDPMGLGDPIGGMSIGSSLDAGEYFRAVEGKENLLLNAAMLFHSRSIGEIRRQQIGARPLSERERDCMSFVAAGLRNSRIAERMGVSEVTVELHLRSARKKLRARTTAQAIARAMIFGDIEI